MFESCFGGAGRGWYFFYFVFFIVWGYIYLVEACVSFGSGILEGVGKFLRYLERSGSRLLFYNKSVFLYISFFGLGLKRRFIY